VHLPRNMTDTLIKNVSDTAFMVAIYRAIESERADALFRDPLARRLAGDYGQRIVASMSGGPWSWTTAMRTHTMAWVMAIRTRIIDDFILSAIAEGVDAILNLGAGLDTRPYRMETPPSLCWFEIDYPSVIDFKEDRLKDEKPRCRLERVKLDLADISARRELFLQLGSRFTNVLVLTEGVIPYLSVEDVGGLAQDLKAQSAFRHWIVDYFSQDTIRWRKRAAFQRKMQNAPFLFEPKDYFGFFEKHGWRPAEIRYLWHEGRRLNRRIPIPLVAILVFAFTSLFMSKQRRDARRKFAAYILLEPTR
jgi:methyltransferase (TIGR00027 family)